MAKRKKSEPKQEGYFSTSVNGHSIVGAKAGGKWTFTCDTWPEIGTQFSGSDSLDGAIAEFMRRALAGAVTVRRLAGGKEPAP